MISVVGETELAERLQVGLADRRRIVDDALGEIHHGDVDLVEPGVTPVARDRHHRLVELVEQHRAVREAAVARPQPARGGEGGQLVAPQIHAAP